MLGFFKKKVKKNICNHKWHHLQDTYIWNGVDHDDSCYIFCSKCEAQKLVLESEWERIKKMQEIMDELGGVKMKEVDGKVVVGHLYKRVRGNGDLYGVFKDSTGKYRVGEYDERDNGVPYYVHEAEFNEIVVAMAVCRMLEEAYRDGHNQGQLDCH
ncbi:hypothetical protein CN984_11965 [Bacillus cereus]|uniref:Uncharacterized protein n=2 Tax=Bacillus cereus TaxID=1396 RepID=A0A2A7FNV0_BACCE|nr:hypothetical protein CON44_18130 [Bacillus cereus]PGO29157.1 hypothetical protein CN984_11965 [Bacillus cereus]